MLNQLLQDTSITSGIQQSLENKSQDPFWCTLWYFIGLPVILAASEFVTWQTLMLPDQAFPMVLLVVTGYTLTWVNRYGADSFRSYRAFGLSTFFLSASFAAILVILAMLRLYYSRTFMVSSYMFSLAWFIGGMFLFRGPKKKFVVVEGGLADGLADLEQNKWEFVEHLNNGTSVSAFDGIVVDFHAHSDTRLINRLADASLQGIPIHHAAAIAEEYTGRTKIEYLVNEGLYTFSISTMYRYVKRFWEVALIILSSVVTLPLALVVAACIKLDSKGPVLFAQQRVGKNGELFTLYKFRSMCTDAEANGARFAGENDHRITRVGCFIRKFRIDEIPQFWNVLKGDMSLIGPRPEQKGFVDYFHEEIPFYGWRHKVRPGITGWSQIKGGYAADLEKTTEKLEHDLYYVKNMSLSIDMLIVYATVKTILTGFGSR